MPHADRLRTILDSHDLNKGPEMKVRKILIDMDGDYKLGSEDKIYPVGILQGSGEIRKIKEGNIAIFSKDKNLNEEAKQKGIIGADCDRFYFMRPANEKEITEMNKNLNQKPIIFEELVFRNDGSFALTGSKTDFITR